MNTNRYNQEHYENGAVHVIMIYHGYNMNIEFIHIVRLTFLCVLRASKGRNSPAEQTEHAEKGEDELSELPESVLFSIVYFICNLFIIRILRCNAGISNWV